MQRQADESARKDAMILQLQQTIETLQATILSLQGSLQSRGTAAAADEGAASAHAKAA